MFRIGLNDKKNLLSVVSFCQEKFFKMHICPVLSNKLF